MPKPKSKVLLVQPSWSSVHGPFAEVATKKLFLPPVGLCYLAAALSQAGHDVKIFDFEPESLSLQEEVEKVVAFAPDLLGVTAVTPTYPIAKRFCEAVKRALPELPVVIGGPHITGTGAENLEFPFNYALLGESERSLPLLVKAILGEIERDKVPGLVFRSGGTVRRIPRAPFIENLDEIPFPKRDLLNLDFYKVHVPGKGARRSTTITTTRGCPFQCVFCSAHLILGRRLRMRSIENTLEEIDEIRNRFQIPHLYFNDSTLTLERERVLQLCEEINQRNLDITWEGMTRVDMIDLELLRNMRRAGFVRFSFGIESGDQRILDTIKKNVTLQELREAYRLCKEAGIETESFAMLGLPGETRETIRRTAWFIRSIPEVRYSSFSIATPYPGTELLEMARRGKFGLKLLSKDYGKYRRYDGGVMEVNGLSPEDLQREQRIGLLIIHLTPRKMLSLIRHFGFLVGFRKFAAIIRDLLFPRAREAHP